MTSHISHPLTLASTGKMAWDAQSSPTTPAATHASARNDLLERLAAARAATAAPEGEAQEEEAASLEVRKGFSAALEMQLKDNRGKLAAVTSEEQDLSVRHEALLSEGVGMQHAIAAALDTPLQSAIYTIQQLLHENEDPEIAAALTTVLKELTSANPYLPTFNFTATDLADETRLWIANTFCDPTGGSPSFKELSAETPLAAAADTEADPALDKALLTVEFDQWEYTEAELDKLVIHCFRRFGLLETFKIKEKTIRAFVKAVREMYNPNPYHTWRHGFDVLQMVSAICASGRSVPPNPNHCADTTPRLLTHPPWFCAFDWPSALESLRSLELLTLLISSIGVDLDHGGGTQPAPVLAGAVHMAWVSYMAAACLSCLVNDRFLLESNSPLSHLYNGRYVNENHHCASLWRLLADPQTNILSNVAESQCAPSH